MLASSLYVKTEKANSADTISTVDLEEKDENSLKFADEDLVELDFDNLDPESSFWKSKSNYYRSS